MILDGLALATLTSAGLGLVYNALPLGVRLWIHQHQLLTRASCAVFTYALFGGTLTALFAAAWLDIIIGILLALTNNPRTAEALRKLMLKISELREKLIDTICQATEKINVQTDKE